MKKGITKFVWGTFLLLVAVFIIANQLNAFVTFGTWSIIAMVFAVAFIVQCVMRFNFAPLPLPLAVLYLVWASTFDWPQIGAWPLFAAAILTWIALTMLIPQKHWYDEIFEEFSIKRNKKTRASNFEEAVEATIEENIERVFESR